VFVLSDCVAPAQAMKSLVEVHMPQNGINHKGITALADAFSSNKQLRHVNLSDNTFTKRGSISMAAVINSTTLMLILLDVCMQNVLFYVNVLSGLLRLRLGLMLVPKLVLTRILVPKFHLGLIVLPKLYFGTYSSPK